MNFIAKKCSSFQKLFSIEGKLYLFEHKQSFEIKDFKIQVDKEPDNSDKLFLTANGMNIAYWFGRKVFLDFFEL